MDAFINKVCVSVCVCVYVIHVRGRRLQTLLGIPEHLTRGLLLVGLAFRCQNCEAFLATWWVDLEAQRGGDEAIVLHVVDVVHLERTAILQVAPAAQFDAILDVVECEGGVLEGDACPELAIEQLDLVHAWRRLREIKDGEERECQKDL